MRDIEEEILAAPGRRGLRVGEIREWCRVHGVATDIDHVAREARLTCGRLLNGGDGGWSFRAGVVAW